MHGRRAFLASLITLVTAATLVVGACGGDPPVPDLEDPRDILAAAAATTTAARTVHAEFRADGTISLDMMGTGIVAPIDIADTTLSGDLDLASGAGRATFAAPGILGLRGEVIVVDGTLYAKTTLTGPRYRAILVGNGEPPPDASPGPTGLSAILTSIVDLIAHPSLEPVKGPDIDCGGTRCYTVAITLTPETLATLAADGVDLGAVLPIDLPIPDLVDATIDLTVRVEKPTGRLAGLAADAALGAAGSVTMDLGLSRWDESVEIQAPPADQVQGGL